MCSWCNWKFVGVSDIEKNGFKVKMLYWNLIGLLF